MSDNTNAGAPAPSVTPPSAPAPVQAAPAAAPPVQAAPPAAPPAPAAKPVEPARPQHINPHARIAANAAARASERTAALATENESLRAQAAKATALEATVSQFAQTQLASLPNDAYRAAVREAAGDDPAAQLRVMNALQKNGIMSPTVPTGATTAPSTMGAPATAPTVGSDPDIEAARRYDELTKKSPMLAAQFRNANREAIARGAQKRAANPN